ncbi:MAG: glutathione S-transferase family protein [Proteobacteria bacterium]|nr:glutathione S-transferase family protein [Pseudomonadota bacterium]
MTPRLITMPHSHYCEKARWALDYSGIAYIEQAHPPLLHMLATKPRGGRSVPVLVHDGGTLIDSTDILLYLDERGANLFPRDERLRNDALQLEDDFDKVLGPHARRWVYSQLLPHSRLLLKVMTPGATVLERIAYPAMLPFVKRLIRKSLRITPASAERSLGFVHQTFAHVEQRLRDGRPYLVGEQFTGADVTFAALAAPVLLPPKYGGYMPGLDEVPAAMREEIVRLRATVAGHFALRLFDAHRGAPLQPAERSSPRASNAT